MLTVDTYSGIVEFAHDVPTATDRIVAIETKRGRELFSDMLIELRELEKLKTVNILFGKQMFGKMYKGISSWSLNGVNVNFDGSEMRNIIEENNKAIKLLMIQLRPKRFTAFKPGYVQHQNKRLRDWGITFK